MIRLALGMYVIGTLLSGCGLEDETVAGDCGDCQQAEKRLDHAPRLIQEGSELLLLATTQNDFALYQEGQTVYASRLKAGARKRWVGEVPGTNIAFPLQVGKVVFLWTDPQRQLPGFGVSPLVLWTAKDGPRIISERSAVGTVATAASSDSRQVVFTTNVTADGLRGDLVHASTRDADEPSILLADIPLDFPSGLCRPLAGFAGRGRHSFPVATYCADGETTATLSIWKHGKRDDLIKDIATPLPFTLEADPAGRNFFVIQADGAIAIVNTKGDIESIDAGGAFGGFVNRKRTAVYAAPSAEGGAELRVARRNRDPETVGPLTALYSGLYNGGGYFRSRTASRSGNGALFGSTFDPSTGLTDIKLLRVSSGAVTTLEEGDSAVGSDLFTSNSRFALYLRYDDVATGAGALFAGNRHGSHQVSDSSAVFDVHRGRYSRISFSENPVFDPARGFQLSRADIVVANASDPSAGPRVVTSQAYLFYLPSRDRRRVVFASESESDGPGLYVASARPDSGARLP